MSKSERLTDGHKLMFHPERVTKWLAGEDIYPIYVEIGPSNKCNYRCSFCALDYTGYKGHFIPKDTMLNAIKDMAEGGVKSVMFAGAGESLLHPDIAEFVKYSRLAGMDVAMTTNGSLLTREMSEKILPHLTWIRISLNAGTPEAYAEIHGCPADNFELVLNNLREAAAIKKRDKLPVTIGTQCLILGENAEGLLTLAGKLKEIGVDYLSLKPFSKHPESRNQRLKDPRPDLADSFFDEIMALSGEGFTISVRQNSMTAVTEKAKPYKSCLGLPFFACLEATGEIYPCHTFMGNDDYSYGNICQSSFREVWHGERRKEIIASLAKMIDGKCRKACRLDQINRYLWELQHLPEHVNFI